MVQRIINHFSVLMQCSRESFFHLRFCFTYFFSITALITVDPRNSTQLFFYQGPTLTVARMPGATSKKRWASKTYPDMPDWASTDSELNTGYLLHCLQRFSG